MSGKHSFNSGPWTMSKGTINNFTLITDINYEAAKVQGRIFYIIETTGTHHTYCGHIVIEPRFLKGWWLYPFRPWNTIPKDVQNKTHWRTFIDKDMDYEEWKQNYVTLFNKYKAKKMLYINIKDPILIYYKE